MSIELPAWPADFPADTLRAEVHAMADAWRDALTATLPPGAIAGLYLKGSGIKPWDSEIDYVPELSDVDVHLALRSPDGDRRFDDLAFALDLAGSVERAFDARVPRALHRPKPQLTFVSALHALPGYLPSPPATVMTLAGEPHPELVLDDAARAEQRVRDRENLLAHRNFVAALPRRAVDRPGRLIMRLVDELPWRVGPVAPRVLSLDGESYEDVWSMNRTALARRLEARGHEALARAYAAYYRAGWRAFRASRAGGDAAALAVAARDTVIFGAQVLAAGIAAAKATVK